MADTTRVSSSCDVPSMCSVSSIYHDVDVLVELVNITSTHPCQLRAGTYGPWMQSYKDALACIVLRALPTYHPTSNEWIDALMDEVRKLGTMEECVGACFTGDTLLSSSVHSRTAMFVFEYGGRTRLLVLVAPAPERVYDVVNLR